MSGRCHREIKEKDREYQDGIVLNDLILG